MTLDFATPHGLAQLTGSFADTAPETLYYPKIQTQVKVQGQLFVARMSVAPMLIAADRMLVAIERLNARIPKLMRALTASGS